jgi:DNA-binding CsgD family transcriptional regulator
MATRETDSVAERYAAIPSDDDLSSVMHEVAQTMGGCATVLTAHPFGAQRPIILFSSHPVSNEREEQILDTTGTFGADGDAAGHAWRQCGHGPGEDVLLVPVGPVSGHSRLVISVYFRDLSDERRHRVEDIYRQRRPFAVGYFRLWQMNRMRRQRCEVLESALHQTDTGVVFLAQGGDLVFANEAAEVILSKGDGLRRRRGSVTATNIAESVSLQVALEHIEAINAQGRSISRQSAPVLALHRASGPPLIVSLLAADMAAIERSDVAVIMYIVDPQLSTAKMLAPVCRLYQLSPVETDLVCHLAQGKALCRAADLMRIKEQTARSYMKQIYLKTGTNRQTELVVLMLSSLVRMKDSIVQEALSVSVRMNGRYAAM